MKKPTTYKDQVKSDRRAAAIERRTSDYRKDTGYRNIYNQQSDV